MVSEEEDYEYKHDDILNPTSGPRHGTCETASDILCGYKVKDEDGFRVVLAPISTRSSYTCMWRKAYLHHTRPPRNNGAYRL